MGKLRQQWSDYFAESTPAQEPSLAKPLTPMSTPNYGKKIVDKIAKGGPQVTGKQFWVCPD
jgi:hypothetical protein